MDDGCSKDSDSCSHVHTEPITSLISLRNKWMGFVKVRKKRRAKSEDDGSTTMYDARYAEKRRFREAQGGSVPIWLERCTMDGTSWLVVSNHSSPFLLPLSRVPHSSFASSLPITKRRACKPHAQTSFLRSCLGRKDRNTDKSLIVALPSPPGK